MSILTEKEVNAAWEDACTADPTGGQQRFKLTRAIESAVLAKLAVMELPEPAVGFEYDYYEGLIRYEAPVPRFCETSYYTADQLRQAYAQGAASVLSAEPVAMLCRTSLGGLDFDVPNKPETWSGSFPVYTLKTIE